ncbi:MAG TPA: EamA family transporter [Verrucomicrobiae bacterium]|jgi:drug/metabolite transporter (DMT)-like permease|nr:EamA family transporter [Verrucomicrobiae bacterium]
MSKVIFLLIVALIFEAVGVVYLSAGLKQIGEVKTLSLREVGRVVRQGAANGRILLGVLLETIFFGFLIVLLKRNDVSLIWPLTSLGFVLTALSARFILHEQVSPVRWVGVVLIVMGAALVSWSEKAKHAQPTASESAVSSVQQP